MGQPAKPIDPDYDPDPFRAALERAALRPPHIETDEERASVEAAQAEVCAGARMIPGAEVTAMIERWRTGPWPPQE